MPLLDTLILLIGTILFSAIAYACKPVKQQQPASNYTHSLKRELKQEFKQLFRDALEMGTIVNVDTHNQTVEIALSKEGGLITYVFEFKTLSIRLHTHNQTHS